MSDDLENWSALGVASALANSYAQDIRGFLPMLSVVLEASLPAETETERKGGLFQKVKPIRKVTVRLDDKTYILEDPGRGPLQAQRIKTVRGIVIKTEPLPIEEWLAELSEAISSRAHRNESAFFALKELLG